MNWTDRHGLWVDGPPEASDPLADEAALTAFAVGLIAEELAFGLITEALAASAFAALGTKAFAVAGGAAAAGEVCTAEADRVSWCLNQQELCRFDCQLMTEPGTRAACYFACGLAFAGCVAGG